jgi:hypothetical protein
MGQDLNVFVHFCGQQQHAPPRRLHPQAPDLQVRSPNKEYTATRRIFIPRFIDEF